MASTEQEREEVIVALERHGPQSVAELQEASPLTPGEVSGAVKDLIKAGSITMDGDVVTLGDSLVTQGDLTEPEPELLDPDVSAPAPVPSGTLTVGAMLAALQGNSSGLAFRAEVELIPQADGTVTVGRVIQVLGVTLNGEAQ